MRDHSGNFPILVLPIELRHAVYRYILFPSNRKVEIVSNLLERESAVKMRFYTTHDLSFLMTNRQIRAEASDLLYAESVFTLNSYPRTQEYGQEPLYGEQCFQISLSRVHKCHLLTPSGTAPQSHRDCLAGILKLRILLQGVVDALASGHCMRYLLVQSYSFERAVLSEKQTMQCDLAHILEPLKYVRGLHLCHIRAMKMSHWPYLRSLEREMMRNRAEPGDGIEPGPSILQRAVICKKALSRAGIRDAFRDPDVPQPNRIFELFGLEPLYRDVSFLENYEDDILV